MTIGPYGLCPICGANGELRERRPHGNDRCAQGHSYPSALAWVPTHKHPHAEIYYKILHDDVRYASTFGEMIVYEDQQKRKFVRPKNNFLSEFKPL